MELLIMLVVSCYHDQCHELISCYHDQCHELTLIMLVVTIIDCGWSILRQVKSIKVQTPKYMTKFSVRSLYLEICCLETCSTPFFNFGPNMTDEIVTCTVYFGILGGSKLVRWVFLFLAKKYKNPYAIWTTSPRNPCAR